MLNKLAEKASSLSQAQIIKVAIIVLLIAAIGLISQPLLQAFNTLGYQPEVATTQTHTNHSDPVNYNVSRITGSYLFGQLEGQSASGQNIPVTRLQLKLRGAFTSTNPELASAIIEGPDGVTRAYKVGGRLYGQAQLKEVFADRVVLSRSGQLETLYFPTLQSSTTSNNADLKDQVAASGYDIPDDIQSLVTDNMSATEIRDAAKELTSATMTPEQRQELIRKRLQDLRNRANRKK